MEYDQAPLPTWDITLPLPHDSFDDDSSSQQFILEVMESPIDNPKDIMPLDASSLPNLEKVEIHKQNISST